jgi:hypothetical protein
VFSILYHINVYRILLLMPASSVAIALALRKNRSLGKTFWFTGDALAFAIAPQHPQTAIPRSRFAIAHNPNFKRAACSSASSLRDALAFAIALPTYS